MSPLDLPLDSSLLGRYLETLGRCGVLPEGGIFRPLYSRPWAEARGQLRAWMEAIGLEVHGDAVGNLFGRLNGDGKGVILTGSHLDTVKQGGRFDGALGILAGLVAVKTLREAAGRPRRPIEVLATCEEEGSRFHSHMWGARAILGMIEPGETESHRDADGVTIGQAMWECGLNPAEIPRARREDIQAFLELHIEQGPILEAEDVAVGVVTAITGITQLTVRVTGQADHAGTTPMDLRRDALVGASRMVGEIAGLARKLGRPAVATVGTARVLPGAVNIVPGEVEFTVDLRHPEPMTKTDLVRALETRCREIAAELRLGCEIHPLVDIAGTPLDPALVDLLEEVLRARGTRYKLMVSGAGHDAQIFAPRIPTAMLFVPSRGGRSHSPSEFTSVEQAMVGIAALAAALYRLAYT